jgi:hypothetical protein
MTTRNPQFESLLKDCLVPASRTGDVQGAYVDTTGWLWMRVLLHLGAEAGGEGITLSLEDSANHSAWAAISGGPTFPATSVHSTSGADGDKPKELMIFLPTAEYRRYVRPVVTQTGGGSFVYGVSIELLNPVTSDIATQSPDTLVAS